MIALISAASLRVAVPSGFPGNTRFKSASPGALRLPARMAGALARGRTSNVPRSIDHPAILSAARNAAGSLPCTPPITITAGPSRGDRIIYRVVSWGVPASRRRSRRSETVSGLAARVAGQIYSSGGGGGPLSAIKCPLHRSTVTGYSIRMKIAFFSMILPLLLP